MDGLDPRNALLEGGKSEALRAAFATVAEATVADEPKFDRRTVHELARLVTCRAFSGPLLELCHLAAAADRKIGINAAKYPADLVRGSSRKYTHYRDS